MAKVIKEGWFGRSIAVLLSTGKTVQGELTETAENFIVIHTREDVDMQIMTHAMIAVRLAENGGGGVGDEQPLG